MKVLHVAESIKGGVGTYLNQMVPLQVRELGEASVRLVAPRQQALQVAAIPEDRLRLFDRPRRSVGSLLALAGAIRDALRDERPDLVHAHSTFAGAMTRMLLAGRTDRPRIVYCPHGWVFDITRSPLKRRVLAWAERAMAAMCDRIVAISEFEARRARDVGIAPDRIAVVMNGIAAEGPAPVPAEWDDSRLKILFVGRLDRQKGLDVLLDATTGLEESVVIRIVGESVLAGSLAVEPRPHVELLGWLGEAEIDGLLAVCDLVVMPSRWEGFGLVALEAMRAGKPVIVSDVGGLPEIVQDGVTGHLFPVGDTVRLRFLLTGSDPSTRARQGRAGRERFLQTFTAERTHAAVMRLYEQVLRGDRSTLATPRIATSAETGAPKSRKRS